MPHSMNSHLKVSEPLSYWKWMLRSQLYSGLKLFYTELILGHCEYTMYRMKRLGRTTGRNCSIACNLYSRVS